jgi:hypothetical protein
MSPIDRPTLIQRLSDAQTALHNLMIGSLAEEVRLADGSMARYTPISLAQLRAYIALLQSELCPRRPITFGFGR